MLKWLVIRLLRLLLAFFLVAIALVYGLIWDHEAFRFSRIKNMAIDLYDVVREGIAII